MMSQLGLTPPEAREIFAISSRFQPRHAVACFRDPDDGLVAHILRDDVGVIATVVRVGEHIALLDINRTLGGVSGSYDAIGDVVNVLWLSLADFGPGPGN